MADVEELEALRKKIDEIDARVVKLLNERAESVLEIRKMKTDLGIPRHDPSREADIMAKLAAANEGPLPNDAIKRIYEHVLYHMRLFPRVSWENNQGESE